MKKNKYLLLALLSAVLVTTAVFAGDIEMKINGATDAVTIDKSDGSEAMRVTSDGKVGIGISNPGGALDIVVDGLARQKLTTTNANNQAYQSFSSPSGQYSLGTGPGDRFFIYGGGITDSTKFEIAADETIHLNEEVHIKNTGEVGIGTTSPKSILDVQSGATETSWLRVKSSPSARRGGLFLHQDSTYGFEAGTVSTSSTTAGRLIWSYRKSSDANIITDNLLTLASNGNVGIGTSNPISKLMVDGSTANFLFGSPDTQHTILSSNNGAAKGAEIIFSEVSEANGHGSITLKPGGSSNAAKSGSLNLFSGIAVHGASGDINIVTPDRLSVGVDGNGGNVNIHAGKTGYVGGGDVNISTSSLSGYKAGDINIKAGYSTTRGQGGNIVIQSGDRGGAHSGQNSGHVYLRAGKDYSGLENYFQLNGGTQQDLRDGNIYLQTDNNIDGEYETNFMIHGLTGNVGIGTTTPSQKLHINGTALATAHTTTSDRRLKRNFSPIDSSLDKILQLNGVEFEWNELSKQEGKHDVGVIAQEIQSIFPQFVNKGADGYLSVDYAKLTAPLIEAVKELKAEKDTQIEKLEAENQALKILVCKDHPFALICR